MMTEQELKQANRTGAPVEWRGRMEYEISIGTVTALIYRSVDERDVLSVELTAFSSPKHVIICRPEDLSLWAPNK